MIEVSRWILSNMARIGVSLLREGKKYVNAKTMFFRFWEFFKKSKYKLMVSPLNFLFDNILLMLISRVSPSVSIESPRTEGASVCESSITSGFLPLAFSLACSCLLFSSSFVNEVMSTLTNIVCLTFGLCNGNLWSNKL